MPSISVSQLPSVLSGTNSFSIYVAIADATSYGSNKFRYILQIYEGAHASGTLKATLKLSGNTANTLIYNASRIVDTFITNTYIDSTDSKDIHRLPGGSTTAHPFSLNDGQLVQSGIKGGVEYSSSATTDPTEYLDLTNNNRYYIRATQDITTGKEFDFAPYKIDGSSDKFLSNAPTTQYLKSTDYGTIAFLNDNTLFSSIGITIQVKVYDSSKSLLYTANLTNSNANGGAIPNSETNTNAERLVYFGSGVKNLQTQTLDSTLKTHMGNDASVYYTIQALDGSSNAVSDLYTFYIIDRNVPGSHNYLSNPCKYDSYRLAWLNRLGAWDYFTFTKKSVEKISTKRESIRNILGTWGSASWDYNSWDRGKKTLTTNSTKSITLNSGYLPEEQVSFLETLFTSPEVYIVGDTYTIPVVVKTGDFTTKSSVNDKLIQYQIGLEFSHDVPTNTHIING